ncbi:MAG: hypothetical protein ACOYJC_03390 [Christensenellales bacterium]|jgi:hypothetical protein
MKKPSTKTARTKAKAEIYSVLSEDMKIGVERMDSILAKYGVKRNVKDLQRSYRLSVGQRIMAEVRDAKGKREILAAKTENGTEYIVVEACSDPQVLSRLQHRLRGCISSLESISGKVKARQSALSAIRQKLLRRR